MNKRIQELRGQVKLDIDQYRESLLKLSTVMLADDGGNEVLNAYLAKFAELIVKECAENFTKVWYEQGLDIRGAELDKFMKRFNEHFGVEQ